MVMRKKRELGILVVVLAICALLVMKQTLWGPIAPSGDDDPHQLVIETRYSRPWQDKIHVYQGQKRILELPETFHWESGDTGKKVFENFGPPQFTAEFMGEEYLLWKREVRYDWDQERKFDGQFLAIGVSPWGRISSASLYEKLPYNAKPWGDRKVEDLLREWEE